MLNRRYTRISRTLLTLSRLEERTTPTAVSWDGGAGTLNWFDQNNWTGNAVPGNTDDVTISGTGGVVLFNGAATTVNSLSLISHLNLTGGSLTVSGAFSSTPGYGLATSGTGVSFSSPTATAIDRLYLQANGGSTISFGSATTYVGGGNQDISADGAGSKIEFPNVLTISSPVNFYNQITATNGARIEMPQLPAVGDGFFEWKASSANSVIDLSGLISTSATGYSYFTGTGGGSIPFSQATKFNRCTLTLDAAGALPLSQVTEFTYGGIDFKGSGALSLSALSKLDHSYLAVNGGSVNVPALTVANYSSFYMSGGTVSAPVLTELNYSTFDIKGGAQLSLPEVKSYQMPESTAILADGVGSKVSLPNLTSIAGSAYSTNFSNASAQNGGRIEMPLLTGLGAGYVYWQANGINSVIDLSGLTTANASGYQSFNAQNGGSIPFAQATKFNRCSLNFDAASTLPLAQVTEMTSCGVGFSGAGSLNLPVLMNFVRSGLSVNGGTVSTPVLKVVDYASFYINGGTQLSLPEVTSYQMPESTAILADGVGSKVSLPNLTSIAGSAYSTNFSNVSAQNGGRIEMPLLTGLGAGFLIWQANGINSAIDLSGLTTANASDYQSFNAQNGGSIPFAQATKFNRCSLNFDAASTLPLAQVTEMTSCGVGFSGAGSLNLPVLTKFVSSGLSVNGGTVSTPVLKAVDYSSFYINGGTQLSLPEVTSYQMPESTAILADGVGSKVSLPNLTSIAGSAYSTNFSNASAQNGGRIEMPLLTGLGAGFLIWQANGINSAIDLSGLTTAKVLNNQSFTAANGGTIIVAANFTGDRIAISVYGGGQFVSNQVTLGVNTVVDAYSLTGSLTSAGTVHPAGGAAGTLTLGGSLTLTPTATLETQFNSGSSFDAIAVNGTVTLGRSKLLTTFNYSPLLGDTFKIIDNDGVDPVVGKFQALDRGNQAGSTPNGMYLAIRYDGGDGNDVSLKAHPVGVQVEGGAVQRSMIRSLTVRFTDPVSLGANPFTLANQSGGAVPDVTLNSVLSGDGKTATITFTGPAVIGTSLPDGKYTLTVNGGDITVIGSGLALDADANGAAGGSFEADFHRIFGDINGDTFTDLIDFLPFRSANGSQSGQGNYNSAFDFNNDGFVDLNDLIAFRARLGVVL